MGQAIDFYFQCKLEVMFMTGSSTRSSNLYSRNDWIMTHSSRIPQGCRHLHVSAFVLIICYECPTCLHKRILMGNTYFIWLIDFKPQL